MIHRRHYLAAGLAIVFCAMACNAPAFAQDAAATLGSLKIVQPWSRATPKSAPVAGGYLTIVNTGAQSDRLIGGSSAIAGKFSVHEMSMEAGVMRMRPVTGGLEIKPGASVELKPSGYHIMFEDLKGGLTEGQSFKATLNFEKAGKVEVDFSVASIGAAAPAAAMEHGHQH
jgi:copper(I)-binding protein